MRKTILILSVFYLIVFNTCIENSQYESRINADLGEIKKRGKIIAVTNFNTVDYFIYKGRPMGFQFELLQRYAEYSNLQLEIIACNDMDNVTAMLLDGKCDIIAMNIPQSSAQGKYASFTEPLLQSRQVLVQRKPVGWESLSAQEYQKQIVSNPIELAGKTIIVQKGTAYTQRLKNISQEIGQNIEIVQVPDHTEQLIQFVAGGEIDYTICDEHIARVNEKYYPQLDVSAIMSFPQNMSWMVRKNADELIEDLNLFIAREKKNAMMAIFYNRYFNNEWTKIIVNNDYFVLNTGRISPYDDDIKKHSEELQWDWRLLAALIYQESNFKPLAESHRGAFGLMQVMPATAQWLGFNDDAAKKPVKNIEIGVKLLKWLDKRFINSIPEQEERIKFILASYNIGYGHITDAQNLTEKYGYNRNNWADVREFLLKKSQPEYYLDPVVKSGRCVGKETYSYVDDVLNCFHHYKNIASLK